MTSLFRSRFVIAGFGVSLLAASCGLDKEERDGDCPRGAEDCRCKSDATCNAGLFCDDDDHCSAASGGSSGSAGRGGKGGGGTAGSVSSGGSAGSSGGSAGNVASGGTSGASTSGGGAGRSGASGETGTSAGEGGEGGSGATGQAGDASEPGGGEGGRADGDGGTSGTAGSSGASSAGTGGSAGSGGGAAGSGGSGGSACGELSLENPVGHVYTDSAIYAWNATFPPPLVAVGAFTLEFYFGLSYDGERTGTFTIGSGIDEDYATCARCLHATTNDNRVFLGSSGTLTVDSDSDQRNGKVRGSITGATLIEVTLDGSFHSTPVPNGACLTLDTLTFDIEPPVPEGWTCPDIWYDDGECDCGCGLPDESCADSSIAACDGCWCGGAGSNCNAVNTGIDPNDNSQCL